MCTAAVLPFIASMSDYYLKHVYAVTYDVTGIPTARRRNNNSDTRSYTLLDHAAKSDVREAARKSSTSTRTALKILQKQASFGASPGDGDPWVCKKIWMYNINAKCVFRGIHHLNLCNDGSSVDGATYCFGIAYSWQLNDGRNI